MSDTVYYHLPENKQFSLSFVNPDLETVENRAQDCDKKTAIREYELDETVYALYAAAEALGAADELDYDFETTIEKMTAPDQAITVRILGLFEGILEGTFQEEDRRLRAYKQVEIDEIPDALAHVDWTGTVPEIGGSLLSSLILKHTLPNANHRTSLALLELYIQAHEYGFDLPEMATNEFEWRTWVNEYIRNSKRLLTVRRNNKEFYYLWKLGCDTVRRKDGIRIHLRNFALDVPRHVAYQRYAERHNNLCVELTEEILRREGFEELQTETGLTKQQFADRLRRMP